MEEILRKQLKGQLQRTERRNDIQTADKLFYGNLHVAGYGILYSFQLVQIRIQQVTLINEAEIHVVCQRCQEDTSESRN